MADTALGPPPARALSVADLQGDARRQGTERVVHVVMTITATLSLVISALIVYSLLAEAWTFITQVEWVTVLDAPGWFPRRGQYGISTLIVGTFIVTGIAMVLALPIGLGSAIYLSEYASPRVRRVLKPVVEILAGIPSVVLGFFALAFIAPEIIQKIWDDANIFSLMAAGLGVGILTIPLVAAVSEDALRSVPHSLREASAGMGAKKVTTTVRIVLPAAVSGLVAAFIISVSRAIGETMVVFIAGGAGGGSLFSTDPLEPGQTMTAAMASQAAGTDSVRGAGLTYQSLFFVGLVLFVMTFALNMVGDVFVRRVRQKY